MHDLRRYRLQLLGWMSWFKCYRMLAAVLWVRYCVCVNMRWVWSVCCWMRLYGKCWSACTDLKLKCLCVIIELWIWNFKVQHKSVSEGSMLYEFDSAIAKLLLYASTLSKFSNGNFDYAWTNDELVGSNFDLVRRFFTKMTWMCRRLTASLTQFKLTNGPTRRFCI